MLLTDNQLEPLVLSSIFDGLWPGLETKLHAFRESPSPNSTAIRRTDREVLEDVLESVRVIHRALGDGVPSFQNPALESGEWEDYYIRGVNLANRRGGPKINMAALRAYNEAIVVAPLDLSRNSMSRLYAYRAALFKRLNRLEEAENDLVLAQKWAVDNEEVEDAMYNMACVKAMSGQTQEALTILHQLVSRESSWREVITQKRQYFANLQNNSEFVGLTKGGSL